MTAVNLRAREGSVATATRAREEAGQRRRLSVFLLLVVLLAALLSALWPQTGPEPLQSWVRTSTHRTADSFFALHALCQRLGYRTNRLRATYGKLPLAATTTLVCLDPLPQQELKTLNGAAEVGQVGLLATWVRGGGHVLVTWPGQQQSRGRQPLAPPPPQRDDRIGALFTTLPEVRWIPMQGSLVGGGDLREVRQRWPAMTDVDRRLAAAFLPADDEPADPPRLQAFATPLPPDTRAILSRDGSPLVIEHDLGSGRVWAASTPLLFSTVALANLQCGHPAMAILHAASDGGRRHLLFDEFVHGQREKRGLWWFVVHGPLGYPVAGLMLLLAVMAWRGAVRLGPPVAEPVVSRRAKEEFVLGVADLEARAGHARAAGAALLRSYERDRTQLDAERAAQLGLLHARLETRQAFGDNDLVALAAAIDAIVANKT